MQGQMWFTAHVPFWDLCVHVQAEAGSQEPDLQKFLLSCRILTRYILESGISLLLFLNVYTLVYFKYFSKNLYFLWRDTKESKSFKKTKLEVKVSNFEQN